MTLWKKQMMTDDEYSKYYCYWKVFYAQLKWKLRHEKLYDAIVRHSGRGRVERNYLSYFLKQYLFHFYRM